MNILTRILTLVLFTLLLSFTTLVNAQIDTKTASNITTLLKQIAPDKNPQKIITRVNELLPQMKKIDFPTGDASLQYLTDYSFEAVKNKNFYTAYKSVIAGLPKVVHENNSWVDDFAATTASPTQYYSSPIGNLVSLTACQQHNCPNTMTLLYNPNSKVLWGILRVNGERSYLLGNPSEDQLVLLLIAIKDDSIMFEM